MAEGAPKRAKAEQAESADAVSTPEYWKERHEVPFSRDYTRFQIQVAREISQRLGKSMAEVSEAYTTILHPYVWPNTKNYIDINSITDDDALADEIFKRESTYSANEPAVKYHEHNRFGCFAYMQNPNDGVIDVHFSNAEFDETGPLQGDKIARRKHELKDLFTDIKKKHPDATRVRGNSWLYNIDAYKRLYPPSYTADLIPDQRESSLATGRAWGQFCDDKLELKKEIADEFLRNIRALEEITPQTVSSALPYPVLQANAAIEDFYATYDIT